MAQPRQLTPPLHLDELVHRIEASSLDALERPTAAVPPATIWSEPQSLL